MVNFSTHVYIFERTGCATVHELDLARVNRERSWHCLRGRIDPSGALSQGGDSSGIPGILEDGTGWDGMGFDGISEDRMGQEYPLVLSC